MSRIINFVSIILPRKFSVIKVGNIRFVGRNKKGFGIRGIALNGFKIEPELYVIKEYLQEGDAFIDIGANTGIYSLHASQFVGSTGKILAFEPNIEMAYCVKQSIALNNFSNITVLALGVSNSNGVIEYFHNFSKPNSFSLTKHDAKASYENIYTVRLDDYFLHQSLNKIDYIKIDVEGNETQVIDGALKIIQKFRPVIQAEFTIADVDINLPSYKVIHIFDSPNLLLVPNEKIDRILFILQGRYQYELRN